MALVVLIAGVWIVVESKSKGSLAFMSAAMALAALVLLVCKLAKTTPAFVLAVMVIALSAWGLVASDPIKRFAFLFNGDSTITGRTYIWDFIYYRISQKPWIGWGYHSYWLVPNSPQLEAASWIRDMPSSHSGFLEIRLDTGYVGYALFLAFKYSSLHGLEVVRRKDPARAWLFLSLAIYIILLNFIESIWIQTDPLWMLYLIVTAETVRCSRTVDPDLAGAGRGVRPP